MNFSKFTKPKINELREQLNLTDEEEKVFDMLCKGRSIVEISCKVGISTRTVDNRIVSIKQKMNDLGVISYEKGSANIRKGTTHD